MCGAVSIEFDILCKSYVHQNHPTLFPTLPPEEGEGEGEGEREREREGDLSVDLTRFSPEQHLNQLLDNQELMNLSQISPNKMRGSMARNVTSLTLCEVCVH